MGNHAKLNYIHVFRAVAIIFIVLGHCVFSSSTMLINFVNTFVKGGSVLFIFISGFLFQYLSDTYTYPMYLKKKFLNVVSPYLFTSILGIVWLLFFSEANPFGSVNKAVQVGMFLTTGSVHNPPTWYIPMTCVLFLSAPILLKLEKTLIFRKYSLLFLMLPVLICISCFVPRLGPYYFFMDGMTVWETYCGYLKQLLFLTVLSFPIYILGMFFAANKERNISFIYRKRGLLWAIFIVGTVAHCLLIYYKVLPSILLFNTIILVFLILGYLWHYDEKIKAHSYINKVLGTVADYSFAVFFLHYYIVKGFNRVFVRYLDLGNFYLNVETLHFGYWISFTIMLFILSFFGSLFLAVLLKKILEKLGIKHTRWILGA